MRAFTSWAALVVLACDARVCPDESGRATELPARLSQTGLFADSSLEQVAPGVFSYLPEFTLWSDGAEKRRWVFVPAGSHVDTSDADDWSFPQGTKFWKEFSVAGRRIETRLLEKFGPQPADWAAVAYIWRADLSDAERSPYGALDVLGTEHDVPAAGECFACHSGRRDRVLGFSAIQLAPRSYDSGERLSREASEALFSEPVPTLDVPGTPGERAALGYLHANCSHCHNLSDAAKSSGKCLNPTRSLSFDLDFTLHTEELATVERTAARRTAVGKVIRARRPDESKVVELMSKRGGSQMPPLGTEHVDDAGLEIIRAWILGL
ncbi:MAG TPA: hypothetical protein VFQ35_06515 [Polyangiaceae bacterium]|nr:hypothetical protein [Polyangiaceae bacterium]